MKFVEINSCEDEEKVIRKLNPEEKLDFIKYMIKKMDNNEIKISIAQDLNEKTFIINA